MFSIFCETPPQKKRARIDDLSPTSSIFCPQNIEQQDFILSFPLSEGFQEIGEGGFNEQVNFPQALENASSLAHAPRPCPRRETRHRTL